MAADNPKAVAFDSRFAGNKVVGRIRSMQCTRDDIDPNDPKAVAKQQMKEQEQRYADHASGKAPLSPKESLELRADIDRLSNIISPGTPNFWPDHSASEKAYLAQNVEEQQRSADNLGRMLFGPVFAALPNIAHALGAPEAVVQSAAVLNANLAGAVALGGRGRMVEPIRAPRAPVGQRPAPKSASPANGVVIAKKYTSLDWNAVVPKKGKYKGESREDHIRRHNSDDLSKDNHGVFKGDGVDITNKAWNRAQDLGISPNANGELVVPMSNPIGVSGGALGTGASLSSVKIIVSPGTTNIITSMPY